MNIVLTDRCNKNCDFCFASGDKNNYLREMTLEKSIEIIDEIYKVNNEESIGILGGEPTLHKDFLKILEYSVNSSKNSFVRVMSNMLFGEEVLNGIINLNLDKNHFGFLTNCNCIKTEELKKRFINNFKVLSGNGYKMSLGYTIPVDTSLEYDINYIEYFTSILKPEVLRFSIEIPSKERMYNPVKNIYYGSKIEGICKHFKDIEMGFDDITFPCMFSEDFFKYYVKNIHYNSCCSPVIEIFPDDSVKFCYPRSDYSLNLNKMKLKDIRDKMFKDCCSDISPKWKSCSLCEYFNYCGGPCKVFDIPKEEIING